MNWSKNSCLADLFMFMMQSIISYLLILRNSTIIFLSLVTSVAISGVAVDLLELSKEIDNFHFLFVNTISIM